MLISQRDESRIVEGMYSLKEESLVNSLCFVNRTPTDLHSSEISAQT